MLYRFSVVNPHHIEQIELMPVVGEYWQIEANSIYTAAQQALSDASKLHNANIKLLIAIPIT